MPSFKFIVSFVALSALSATVSAHRRNWGNWKLGQASIHVCKNAGFQGDCQYINVSPGTCANVPDGWNDSIGAIENDSKWAYKCVWYRDFGCTGESYNSQDDSNLSDGNGRFDDSISSFSCQRRGV